MIVIGSEVLSGRTRDENLGFIAGALNELGIELREGRVIPDDEAMIVEAINATRTRYDYVFTSGGIGPTHDDITADCVARAFGVEIDLHAEAVEILRRHYPPSMLNPARMRMARIPRGAALVKNPVSHAPGFRMENVYVFAGVPAIMRAMFEEIRHELVGGPARASITISSFLAEGAVADELRAIQTAHPEVEIGSYPFYRRNRFGTSIVLRSHDPEALARAAEAWRAVVRGRGETPLEGEMLRRETGEEGSGGPAAGTGEGNGPPTGQGGEGGGGA